MTFLPTARKYRPKSFSEVFGQVATKTILKNSILLNYPISAILMSGIRGTGKTTIARVFAKALNCENFKTLQDVCGKCKSCIEADNGTHPDIIEYDSASNNGVDFIRDLEYVVRQIPSYKKRIIIFDEVHMFSAQAQNALLKILEEPPKDLTFILVTTNPENIVNTVRSRCLSMPLKALTVREVKANLKWVLDQEGLKYTDELIDNLSLYGGGSLRDVQQILDQIILASDAETLNLQYLQDSIGIISQNQYKKLAAVLCSLDIKKAYEAVNKWYEEGVDLQLLFEEGMSNIIRDFALFLAKAHSPDIRYLTGIPHSIFEKNLTLTYEQVKFIQSKWEPYLAIIKTTSFPKLTWEMFFLNICQI